MIRAAQHLVLLYALTLLASGIAHAEDEFYSQNYASSGLLNEESADIAPSFDASLSAEQAAAERLLYSPAARQSSSPPAPTLPGFKGYEGRFTKRQAGVESRTVPNDQSTVIVDR